jgi:hypothetical protein
MKSRLHSICARTALAATVVLAVAACAHDPYGYYAPAPHHSRYVTYYDYWYYPAIGSYYDPRSHVYIYFEGGRWTHARALPPRLRPHLGRHVTIHSPHERPYEEHHRHREQYRPERYRPEAPGDRPRDIWLDAPRREPPQRDHDRDDRRHDDDGRDRSPRESARDRDHDHKGDRNFGLPQRGNHEQRRGDQRQPPATRGPEVPGRLQVPAGQEHKSREREMHKEESQTRGRPHGNGERDEPPGPWEGRSGPERRDWEERWR